MCVAMRGPPPGLCCPRLCYSWLRFVPCGPCSGEVLRGAPVPGACFVCPHTASRLLAGCGPVLPGLLLPVPGKHPRLCPSRPFGSRPCSPSLSGVRPTFPCPARLGRRGETNLAITHALAMLAAVMRKPHVATTFLIQRPPCTLRTTRINRCPICPILCHWAAPPQSHHGRSPCKSYQQTSIPQGLQESWNTCREVDGAHGVHYYDDSKYQFVVSGPNSC